MAVAVGGRGKVWDRVWDLVSVGWGISISYSLHNSNLERRCDGELGICGRGGELTDLKAAHR